MNVKQRFCPVGPHEDGGRRNLVVKEDFYSVNEDAMHTFGFVHQEAHYLSLPFPGAMDTAFQQIKPRYFLLEYTESLSRERHHLQYLRDAIHTVARKKEVWEDKTSFRSADKLNLFLCPSLHQ